MVLFPRGSHRVSATSVAILVLTASLGALLLREQRGSGSSDMHACPSLYLLGLGALQSARKGDRQALRALRAQMGALAEDKAMRGILRSILAAYPARPGHADSEPRRSSRPRRVHAATPNTIDHRVHRPAAQPGQRHDGGAQAARPRAQRRQHDDRLSAGAALERVRAQSHIVSAGSPTKEANSFEQAEFGTLMSGPRTLRLGSRSDKSNASPRCPPIVGSTGNHPMHALAAPDDRDGVSAIVRTRPVGFDPDNPQVRPGYLGHLRGLGDIPRVAHVSWKSPAIFTSKANLAVHGVQAIGRLNPAWQVILYNNSETERFIQTHIPMPDWDLIKDMHIVEKADLFRLLVVYFKGGLYQDIDRLYSIRMADLLHSNTRMLLPTAGDVNFAQDFMMTSPCNELHRNAIELNLRRRRQFAGKPPKKDKAGVRLFVLGPDTYFHAATFTLYGGALHPIPGKEVMEKIRRGLNATHGVILTHREEWCDSIVYRRNMTCKHPSYARERLYAEARVVHWVDSLERGKR